MGTPRVVCSCQYDVAMVHSTVLACCTIVTIVSTLSTTALILVVVKLPRTFGPESVRESVK